MKASDQKTEAGICEIHEVHPDKVKEAVKYIPNEEKLQALGEFYKVFSEPSRLKILYLLSAGEMCVCDIADSLSATVSGVSHQLKILKTARLVKFRKDGKNCLYSLADDHISKILSQGTEHINE